MAKLSEPMVKALREIAKDPGATFSERTGQALRRRFLITDVPGGFGVTPSGRALLDGIGRADLERAERLERASRPVPAQIGEPSAARPLVLDTDMGNGCDCDQDGCKVCFPEPEVTREQALAMIGNVWAGNAGGKLWSAFHSGDYRTALEIATAKVEAQNATPESSAEPAVPQAWIDQLVTLLDADARIVKREQGWRVDRSEPGSIPGGFLYQWDRLDAAAAEAIRLGIAEVLPATPGQGVIRLVLADAFRERRAADRGVKPGAEVRYRAPLADKPGKRRMEVARIEQGMARCFPLEHMDNAPAQWLVLEHLEPVTD